MLFAASKGIRPGNGGVMEFRHQRDFDEFLSGIIDVPPEYAEKERYIPNREEYG